MGTSHNDANKRQALLDGQKHVLDLINRDQPLPAVLTEMCRVVEAQAEGMMVSILLVDDTGTRLVHGAAPSLPDAYNQAVDGITIGDGIGSCGTAAATGKPMIVEDISTHPYWVPFRDLAYAQHGLRACWSTPIFAYDGAVIGTFALYYREARKPTLADRKLIDFTSHLVTIAINRHREQTQLQAMVG